VSNSTAHREGLTVKILLLVPKTRAKLELSRQFKFDKLSEQTGHILNASQYCLALRTDFQMLQKPRSRCALEVTFDVVDQLSAGLATCHLARTGTRTHHS
jgi:hypothetical protein